MFRFISRRPIRLRTLPGQIYGVGEEIFAWAQDAWQNRKKDV